jgi:putative ABC transport system permease protein
MRLALLELRRRPGRFSIAAVILTLVALLLLFLGGLLDGLIDRSISAVTAQPGQLITYSSTSEYSFVRSRITPDQRAIVASTPGVTSVGGIGVAQLGARLPGNGPRDLVDVALFGYELAPKGVPPTPPDGEGYADVTLRDQGISNGMTVLLGPARSPVKVIGFVSGTSYNGQGVLWASPATWRAVQGANRPDQAIADGVFQSLTIVTSGQPSTVAEAIDAATGGTTTTLTKQAAAYKQPGVEQQQSVFNQIIGVTVAIAIVVIALFFALLTIERAGLYGMLKALGARTRSLFSGLVIQAVVVTLVGALVATALALALAAAIPAGSIPFTLSTARILTSLGFLLLASVIGCAFSLRRIVHIDPAAAIGSSS